MSAQAEKRVLRIFLDVDGTLYRYGDTGFHRDFGNNMKKSLQGLLPHLSPAGGDAPTADTDTYSQEALRLHNLYHHTYGNPLVGVLKDYFYDDAMLKEEREKQTIKASPSSPPPLTSISTMDDPPRSNTTNSPLFSGGSAFPPTRQKVPTNEVLENHFRDFITVDYTRIAPNPLLDTMLRAMNDEDGFDLWLFTNANKEHALRCTEALGVHHHFLVSGHTSSCDANERLQPEAFKCVDAFDQWGLPHTPLSAMGNKPFPIGYERADAKARNWEPSSKSSADQPAGVEDRIMLDDQHAQKVLRVMVEDAFVNLRVPKEMGWVTVWIRDGRPMPTDSEVADIQPDIVIDKIEDLRDALKVFIAQKNRSIEQ